MDESQQAPVPAIDQIANGQGLPMYKAMVPYLPRPLQQGCSLYLKIRELQNLLTYYNSGVSACSVEASSREPEMIAAELKTYATPAQNQMLDQAINLLSALKLYRSYQDLM